MDFLTRHRDRFRLAAIISSLYFNFALIYASWSDDSAAWTTTLFIVAVAIVSALVCHITKDNKLPKNSTL